MDNLTFISVIVPVYNAERYLSSTINSILGQTIADFELILVNDGSVDHSEQICKDWASKDVRVKYVYQTNAGAAASRAHGVEIALGEWIMFCDADDILPSNALEILLDYTDGHDIVIGKIEKVDDEKECKKVVKSGRFTVVDNLCFMRQLLDSSITLLPSPCARLYKKKLFSDKIFDIPSFIKRGEDFIMNFHYAMNASTICYVDDVVYYYRQHSLSSMHTFKNSWAYEKSFLEVLLSPVLVDKKFCVLNPYIMQCVLRSLGNAYHDTSLKWNTPDFLEIRRNAKNEHLNLLGHITLLLIYFPAKLRYFLYRVCRRLLSYLG